MKKFFLTLSVVMLLLTSCSNDESNSEIIKSPQIPLVTKWTETYNNGNTYTAFYTYNGAKIDKIVYGIDSSYTKYTYSNDLITKIEYFTVTDELTETIRLEYDANDRLIKEVTTEKRDEVSFEFISTYTHIDSTTIIERYFDSNSFGESYEYEKRIYLVDNEVARTIYMANNYTTNFTYLDKNNPFKNIIGFDKIFFSNYLGEKGNQKALENKISHDMQDSITYISFNTNDYPTEMVQTYKKENAYSGTKTITIQYSN